MNITDLKIRHKFENQNEKLKALVSITIDDCLAIHEIKVIQAEDRLFVAMPSRKEEDGTYRDIIHPTKSSFRREIERVILKAYTDYISLFK